MRYTEEPDPVETKETLVVPASEEQAELIADHLLVGTPLMLLPTERAWLAAKVRKAKPGKMITSAEINLEDATFTLTLV